MHFLKHFGQCLSILFALLREFRITLAGMEGKEFYAPIQRSSEDCMMGKISGPRMRIHVKTGPFPPQCTRLPLRRRRNRVHRGTGGRVPGGWTPWVKRAGQKRRTAEMPPSVHLEWLHNENITMRYFPEVVGNLFSAMISGPQSWTCTSRKLRRCRVSD